ncbi:hypothetical protein LOTGIDRAFT_176681 [Lottia gigantea]|uniref:TIR domain-containing protein n=1 Tax=Lottia gigantea TaxID=225164 RepID=V4ANK1_LOTGI|nr:hypothetical protein LOTGIDRAFT_176681 [Lottia gigantea]ESO95211.1 hypothetical protein LOTGIDRAFT_176681 [Lottia gigantea]
MVFMDKMFTHLPHLKELNFSNNHIEYMTLSPSTTLTTFRLSGNHLTKFPKFCEQSKALFPNLQKLYIDRNCIYKIASSRIDCLKKLKYLNISELHMEIIPNNLFSKLTSLRRLYIEHSDSLKSIHPLAFNSSSLDTLFIRSNKLFFYEPYVNPRSILANTPNLKYLDISDNILGKMSERDWTEMLKCVPKLLFLGISMGEIEKLPEVVPGYLHNLNDFRAEYNGITKIPANYLSPLKKLLQLYLNDNKLSKINEGDLPKSLEIINLAFNPFVCDCRLLWFKNFIEKNPQIFPYYPRLYLCENEKPLADFRITIKSCLFSQKINNIIMSTSLGLVCLVLGFSVVYHYRWRLRYFVHVLNLHRRKYFSSNGQRFLYDIYVVCANISCEEVYIRENLVTILENDGKTVFFPRRDASPNKPTVTQTLEQMDRSKCILICISDAFSSDQLCEFQVNMALERSIHDRDCTVIVVILEELSPDNVNKTINHLLRTHQNYLLWDEEVEANALFWRKFNEYI